MTARIRERGYLVLTVSLILAIVATSALWLAQSGGTGRANAEAALARDQVRYVAEAGLRHALWQSSSGSCAADLTVATTPFGGHAYQASAGGGGSVTSHSIVADADTWISENASSDNFGSDGELRTKRKTGTDFRGLLHFDLSSIPAGSRVLEATLHLYVSSPDEESAVELHEITQAWDEGTVTWLDIASHFEPSIAATIPRRTSSGWQKLHLTPLAQAWVNDPTANYGLMLIATSDDRESKVKTKEALNSAHHPRLELVVGADAPGASSIQATGIHSGGPQRTVSAPGTPASQAAAQTALLPGTALDDTTLKSGSNSSVRNYGASAKLWVTGGSENALLRFDLSHVPEGATLVEARLGLYLQGGGLILNGIFDVHRITRDWKEGDQDDEFQAVNGGATWNWADYYNRWTDSGGDFEASPVATTTILSLTPGWVGFDVTSAVTGWLDGEANHGFLIRGKGGTITNAEFASGDAPLEWQRPYLRMTFACACGTPCALPRGDRTLLFVVANPNALDGEESLALAAFEGWGYAVTLADDAALQGGGAESLASAYDVLYVSGSTSWPASLPDFAAVSRGIVFASPELLPTLGLAGTTASDNGAEVTFVEVTHPVSRVFAPGDVAIERAPGDRALLSAPLASDLAVLATSGANAAVAALAKDDETTSPGAGAAGHRVYLPLGLAASARWSSLSNAGRLLVHRALEWAATSPTAISTAPVAHWRFDETSGVNAVEEINGNDGVLTGGPVWESGAPVNGGLAFDGSNDRVIVPDDAALDLTSTFTIAAWIENRSATLGDTYRIVSKSSSGDSDNYWFGVKSGYLESAVDGNTVTGSFELQPDTRYHVAVTFDNAADQVQLFVDGLAYDTAFQDKAPVPNAANLQIGGTGESGEWWDGLIDEVRIYDVVLTPGEIASLHAGASGGEPDCDLVAADDFESDDYSGSTGNHPWTGDWIEVNESDGANRGDERTDTRSGMQGVRVRDNDGGGEGVERGTAVPPGVTAATFSYRYMRFGLDDDADYVDVSISANGGSSWDALARLEGPADDASPQSGAHDISAYLTGADVRIRFVTSPGMGLLDAVYFDDIEIRFEQACSP